MLIVKVGVDGRLTCGECGGGICAVIEYFYSGVPATMGHEYSDRPFPFYVDGEDNTRWLNLMFEDAMFSDARLCRLYCEDCNKVHNTLDEPSHQLKLEKD